MELSKSHGLAPFTSLLLLAASKAPLVTGQVMLNLCADYNTADTARNISIYQTNGLCSNFCREDYAYAITQESSCWCSNYTPHDDTQVDLGDCNINCPAYPIEKCGGRGLFGYVELNGHLPSGTQGGDDDEATSTTSVSSTPL
jgi:cell wall integrity and stress response component